MTQRPGDALEPLRAALDIFRDRPHQRHHAETHELMGQACQARDGGATDEASTHFKLAADLYASCGRPDKAEAALARTRPPAARDHDKQH